VNRAGLSSTSQRPPVQVDRRSLRDRSGYILRVLTTCRGAPARAAFDRLGFIRIPGRRNWTTLGRLGFVRVRGRRGLGGFRPAWGLFGVRCSRVRSNSRGASALLSIPAGLLAALEGRKLDPLQPAFGIMSGKGRDGLHGGSGNH
jgi:hypothetical protein